MQECAFSHNLLCVHTHTHCPCHCTAPFAYLFSQVCLPGLVPGRKEYSGDIEQQKAWHAWLPVPHLYPPLLPTAAALPHSCTSTPHPLHCSLCKSNMPAALVLPACWPTTTFPAICRPAAWPLPLPSSLLSPSLPFLPLTSSLLCVLAWYLPALGNFGKERQDCSRHFAGARAAHMRRRRDRVALLATCLPFLFCLFLLLLSPRTGLPLSSPLTSQVLLCLCSAPAAFACASFWADMCLNSVWC